jgi:hypothetical protein
MRRPWRSAPDGRGRTPGPASAAALLLAAGVLLIVVLHPLRADVDPARHYISEYGNREWHWLLSAALGLIGGGLAALGFSVRDSTGTRAVPYLLQASGALLAVAAVVSTDRQGGLVETATLGGKVHGLAAIGAFCLLVLAMSTTGLAARSRASARAHRLGLAGAVVAVVSVLAVFAVAPEAHGLRQRVFLIIVFTWLLAVAAQVRREEGPRAPRT